MASADDYAKWLVENESKEGSEEFNTVLRGYEVAKERESLLKDNPNRGAVEVLDKFLGADSGFMRGYSDTASGVGQLAEKMGGGHPDPEIRAILGDTPVGDRMKKDEARYQAGRVLEGDTGVDWDRLGGNILNPTTVVGAGTAVPAKLGGKVLQGMAIGTGYGMAQPVYGDKYWETKAMQGGTGAVTGAAFPLAGAAVKKVYNALIPQSAKSIERELSKDLTELVGPQKEKVIHALENYTTHVNKPTPSQAIAQATRSAREAGLPDEYGEMIVRLSKDIMREPTVGANMKTRIAEQELGREGLIKSIAGTSDEMASAIKNRKTVTDPLYEAVRKSSKEVDAAPVVERVNQILSENKNRDSITVPLKKILSGLTEKGKVEKNPNNLMSLSENIKEMMGTTSDGKPAYNVKVLDEIKGLLDDQIGKGEPAYAQAMQKYKELSAPINQMKIGRELAKALENPSEKETAAKFLTAMQEAPRTLKKATGFSRYNKLDDVLTLDQVDKIKRVSEELLDQAKADKMASGTRSVVGDVMGKEAMPKLKLLERNVVIFNAIMSKLEKGKSPEYKEILSQLLNDPDKLAKALQGTDEAKRRVAMDIVSNISKIQAAQQPASVIGGE